jgi:hypothetical protein
MKRLEIGVWRGLFGRDVSAAMIEFSRRLVKVM